MDHLDFIVTNFMGNSIGTQRVNRYLLNGHQTDQANNFSLPCVRAISFSELKYQHYTNVLGEVLSTNLTDHKGEIKKMTCYPNQQDFTCIVIDHEGVGNSYNFYASLLLHAHMYL